MSSGSISSKFIDVTNPMLRVFDSQEKDTSIIDYEMIQRYCTDGSDIQNQTKQLYEILLTDRDAWMNLSDAFLECRVKIINAANNADIAAGNIALVNSAYSLFKRAELQFDGKTLVESIDYPGLKNQITGLLMNSVDSEKQLSNELWYPDRSDNLTIPLADIKFYNTTAGARFGQRLRLTGTGADLHIVNVIPYPGLNPASVNLQAGDTIGAFYNGKKLQIFINNVRVANDNLVSAGGGANATITNIADGHDVRFFLDGVEVVLRSENGSLTSFVGNATPVLVFRNGTANVTTLDDTIPAIGTTNTDGFFARRNKFRNSATGVYDKIATFWLPLRKLFGFFDYNRVVMKGMTTKLSLYVNDDARALYRDASAVDGRLKFYALNLWVPYVVAKPTVATMLNSKLLENEEVAMGFYDWKYYEYPTEIPAAGNSQIQWVLQQDVTKPVRIFAFFQPANAQSSQLVNSQLFGKAFVQTARCIINSNVIYPREEYNIDFTSTGVTQNNINRAYIDFLRAGGKAFTSSSGPSIDIDEYSNLYQIFCFDMTKQDNQKIYEYSGSTTVQLRFTFNAPPGVNLKLYSYVVNERVASVRGSNNKLDFLSA